MKGLAHCGSGWPWAGGRRHGFFTVWHTEGWHVRARWDEGGVGTVEELRESGDKVSRRSVGRQGQQKMEGARQVITSRAELQEMQERSVKYMK